MQYNTALLGPPDYTGFTDIILGNTCAICPTSQPPTIPGGGGANDRGGGVNASQGGSSIANPGTSSKRFLLQSITGSQEGREDKTSSKSEKTLCLYLSSAFQDGGNTHSQGTPERGQLVHRFMVPINKSFSNSRYRVVTINFLA